MSDSPLTYTFTRLLVNDLSQTFAFYHDVLGFPAAFNDGEHYAELNTGAVMIALFGRGEMARIVGTAEKPASVEVQDRVALIFEVANVDATHKELSAKGVAFLGEPADQPAWGIRVAFFRDPDGNLIEINQRLPMEQGQ
jgi:lactoylglutathione lyase